jgi:hypothetical protein
VSVGELREAAECVAEQDREVAIAQDDETEAAPAASEE